MTIGEKIKYLRSLAGLTQSQLANASKIHLVSIKKYETNKMQPLLPQIEKIADALNISPNALIGLEKASLRFETIGDLMGIIIILLNSNIISIEGERGDDDFLEPETVLIHFNPVFTSLMNVCINKENNSSELLPPDKISFYINNPFVIKELLNWEKMNHIYNRELKRAGDNPNESTKAALDSLASMKEKIELEIQRDMLILDTKSGIKVKNTTPKI